MLDSGTIRVPNYQYFLMKNKAEKNSFSNLTSLREIAASILKHICTQTKEESPSSSNHSTLNEIEHFLKTGDFEAKTKKIVCANPTLLTLVDKHWEEVS